MDLNEQANEALAALLSEPPLDVDDDWNHIARMMWFDGYKAGMDATKAWVDEAFAKLEASLS